MDGRLWLVLGGSSGVGAKVLDQLGGLAPAGSIHAVSRASRGSPPAAGVAPIWHAGDLDRLDPGSLPVPTHVLSAGPLDAFGAFAERANWPAGTVVVALSSMSASTKVERGHRSERAVAQRLLGGEALLADRSRLLDWRLVLLRPTLIWGAGDRSITPLLALARRTGVLPLPRGATGLRQPVHAADLARAMVQAAHSPDIGPGPWPAPGGEVLAFDDMLARALAVTVPQARLLRIPDGPCRVLEAALSRLPGRVGRVASQLLRARRNLDIGEATVWPALGIKPRGFNPDADSFPTLSQSVDGAAS